MNRMDKDRRLENLFEELRRAEEASAPSFRQTLERKRARRTPSSRSAVLALAASMALFALAAAVAFHSRRPLAPPRPQTHAALGKWKSPTDSLLRTPGAELLDSIPSLGQPMPSFFPVGESERRETPPAEKRRL